MKSHPRDPLPFGHAALAEDLADTPRGARRGLSYLKHRHPDESDVPETPRKLDQ